MRDNAVIVSLAIKTVETPLGPLMLVADDEGFLRAADFADYESRMLRLLDRRIGQSRYTLLGGNVPVAITSALNAYFAGALDAIRHIPLRTNGSTFQNRIWTALRAIAPGHSMSYSALARELGCPQSARAVGHANGANPFSIIVPCHRLVGANGSLTGYAGGIERKRWLLDHEARNAALGAGLKAGI
ncbi:methylated-DNA--[protein]-cysteine S-methyltransferase [Phyllobacterium salinisoli]|uniref:Methylated-DNA--[protein]-cysteine S-methyltransferase n=1 Tax=Phyllobacterium salinisoli TaxID=1899321 RepID=A0A368K2I9_9HYPH|nr:methylated-DNA--[protein]-cysteine S-methyltransferase [Phyllobacterium salinisoli]RCS23431.1 methylated-DNA--[protein]-cysteine S-methyltransferase [Phyllobacterium salinisoli]